MFRILPSLAAAVVLALAAGASGQVVISEVLASNATGLADEDGFRTDWIELYNRGAAAVDLRGWHLTDDPLRPGRWEFPAVTLAAGEYLIVFASGKDRADAGRPLHTDFSLAAEGEFLALTGPGGAVVDALTPESPALAADVSWGLADNAAEGARAPFYHPTPGAPNDAGSRASLPPVCSAGSRTFSDPFKVVLSSPQAGARIFYTVDGSTPTVASTLYVTPLIIRAGTRLRAVALVPGLNVSPVSGSLYLQLDPEMPPVSSALPLMILDNFAAARPEAGTPAGWMVFEPGGTLAASSLTAIPDIATPAYIKVRGSSTATAEKYSLAVESRNETGSDRDLPVCGFPADSDWVLTAPFEYDRSLLRNSLMYALSRGAGRYAPRTRQVELYLNTDGGPVSAADYAGVYTLTERIKQGPERVDVAEISPLDNLAPAVSGGYVLKIDRPDPGDTGFTVAGQTLYFVDPDEDEVTAAQRSWLTAYFDGWHRALNAPDFFDPGSGYAKWGDPAAFIDHHLLNVAAKNVDALRLSSYFSKDRSGRLAPGPLWDFDRSLDSLDTRDDNFNTWRGETGDLGTDFFRYPWYQEMFRDQNFWQQWIDRLDELRRGPLSDGQVRAVIAAQAAELPEAAARNFARWPGKPPRFGGWTGETGHLRDWFINRLNWMDAQFTRPPVTDAAGGAVSPGFPLHLDLSPQARPGTVIYYTTDGSDPRRFDATNGQQIITTGFVSLTHPVKVHLPVADIGTAWRGGAAFNDAAWWSGVQGVGFDDSGDYDPYISFPLEAPPAERRMQGVTQSCYLRYHFSASAAQIAPLTFLRLRVRCDDGMAAWLNGVRLPVSIKEPALLSWNSGAISNTADATAVQFTDFIIPAPGTLLREGDNVLAVQGLNYLLTSSDFLIQVELSGGRVPEDESEIAPGARVWSGSLTVQETTHLVARAYDPAGPFTPWPYTGAGSGQTPVGSHWSAPLRLSLLTGTVPATAARVALEEIMYHPRLPDAAEIAAGFENRDDFEYLVLRNTGTVPVDLTGVHFAGGVTFTMPSGPACVLAPGACGILVRRRAAFLFRFGTGLNVLGEYGDKLSNGGETLTLLAADDTEIFSVTWDDSEAWPEEADGGGYSLVRRSGAPVDSLPASWRRSLDPGGELRSPLSFEDWQRRYFPGGGGASGPLADPDGDGLVNAAEYAAGTGPLHSGEFAGPVSRLRGAAAGRRVEISLPHRTGAPAWILESSADLAAWERVDAAPAAFPNPGGTETLRWSLPLDAARRHFRARVAVE